MKKNIITFVIILAGLGGLMWWGRPAQTSTGSISGSSSGTTGTLTASDKLYDFGTISMKNGDVSKDFVFTNSTGKDITIRGLETSCMCTSALLVEPDGKTVGPFGMAGMGGMTTTNELIKAGTNRTLRVIYNPNAHGPAGVGQIDRFITITDASGSTLQFEIKASVTP